MYNFSPQYSTKQMDNKNSLHEKIRANIKNELKKRKITYEIFAGLFGRKQSWFSHIMTGRTKFTIELLYKIAEKLDIDPASLLPGRNPNKKPTLEEYIKSIIKEELEKFFKDKK